MDKYILQILENNSRVIVPEFGAFIIKQRSPLTIVFNEFLQYNDGMLVDAISKGESSTRDAAKEKIDAFVKKVNTTLNRGDAYTIEGLGDLIKSATGKISLAMGDTEKQPAKHQSSPQPKEEAPSGTQEKEDIPKVKTEKEQADSKPVAEDKKQPSETEPEKKEPVEKKADDSAGEKKKETEPKPTPPPPQKKSTSEVKPEAKTPARKPEAASQANAPAKTDKAVTSRSYGAGSQITDKEENEEVVEKKKKSNVIWWVLVILINLGIFAFFYSKGHLDGLFQQNTGDEEMLDPAVDEPLLAPDTLEPAMDPMIEEQPAQSTQTEQPKVQQHKQAPAQRITSGKRYYVVAGVFSVESNADNLVKSLRNKGYNAEKFGKIGQMHAVSYGVFSSSEEASRLLRNVKQSENSDAWIKVVNN